MADDESRQGHPLGEDTTVTYSRQAYEEKLPNLSRTANREGTLAHERTFEGKTHMALIIDVPTEQMANRPIWEGITELFAVKMCQY